MPRPVGDPTPDDVPCPYCGQLNERSREICWACFKPLNGKKVSDAAAHSRVDPEDDTDAWSSRFPGELEALSRRRRRLQILLATPGIAILLFTLHNTSADYRRLRDAVRLRDARTAQAEAAVTEIHGATIKGRLYPNSEGTFVFTTASGQVVERRFGVGSPSHVGAKFTVRYDPENLKNYSIGDEFNRSDVRMWCLSLLWPFLLIASNLLFVWHAGRAAKGKMSV